MDQNNQTDSFMFDLDNLIRRYQQEFDLNDQTIVGALEFAKLRVLTDAEILFTMDESDPSSLLDDEENDGYDDFISPSF